MGDTDNAVRRQLAESDKCRLAPEELDIAFQEAEADDGPVLSDLLIAVKDGMLQTFRTSIARQFPSVREVSSEADDLGPDEIAIIEDALPGPIVKVTLKASIVAAMLRWDEVEQVDLDRELRPM